MLVFKVQSILYSYMFREIATH